MRGALTDVAATAHGVGTADSTARHGAASMAAVALGLPRRACPQNGAWPVSTPFLSLPPRVHAAKCAAARPRPAGGWHLSTWTAARWSTVVAVLMATQYLAQPFVWAHWPVADVLQGFAEVARDRLLVAWAIAAALVLATRVPAHTIRARVLLVGAAVVAGAVAGEFALAATGTTGERADALSVTGRVAQWIGIAICVASIYGLWLRGRTATATARRRELEQSAAEANLVRTQLQTLRQQIDPHFLFNTLATIRHLREADAEAGGRLLRHLAGYLRSTLASAREETTLAEEVDLVASYLAIVGARMSGRLTVDIDVPADLRSLACPPLAIATLVENAVKHGVAPSPDGGSIVVRARCEGAVLEIVVTDTGVGIVAAPAGGGSGLGLANLRERLRALYGTAASLTVGGNAPRGVRAVIRIPADAASRT